MPKRTLTSKAAETKISESATGKPTTMALMKMTKPELVKLIRSQHDLLVKRRASIDRRDNAIAGQNEHIREVVGKLRDAGKAAEVAEEKLDRMTELAYQQARDLVDADFQRRLEQGRKQPVPPPNGWEYVQGDLSAPFLPTALTNTGSSVPTKSITVGR